MNLVTVNPRLAPALWRWFREEIQYEHCPTPPAIHIENTVRVRGPPPCRHPLIPLFPIDWDLVK